jgi:hypothetical protein
LLDIQYKYKIQIFFFLDLEPAKSLIIYSKSNEVVISAAVINTGKAEQRSSTIVDRQ